jgi:hypothetical protein
MQRASLLCGILLLALGAGGCPAPFSGPPDPDHCPQASGSTIESVELGTASGDEQPFMPVADGDELHGIRGGQGATMVGWTFRVHGTLRGACEHFLLAVAVPEDAIAHADQLLRTYDDGNGARVTKPLWLPGAYNAYGDKALTAIAQSGERSVTLDGLTVR